MTTIATDGFSIAADGMTQHRSTVISTSSRKLHRLPDRSAVGGAGDVGRIKAAISALSEGRPLPTGEYSLLRLEASGRVLIYDGASPDQPVDVPAPAAIGSGMDLALGALEVGASPREAIAIAKRRDPHTGGTIRSVQVRP